MSWIHTKDEATQSLRGATKGRHDGDQVTVFVGDLRLALGVEQPAEPTYLRLEKAAVAVTRMSGLDALNFTRVAEVADLSRSLLYHYFKDVDDLRRRVVEIAIDTKDAALLLHGIRAAHPLALSAPPELRESALAVLSSKVMGGR